MKCRGPEYLRVIYGPEYLDPEKLGRLRSRGLSTKRQLALRGFKLGIEALPRFVRREPLRFADECALGVWHWRASRSTRGFRGQGLSDARAAAGTWRYCLRTGPSPEVPANCFVVGPPPFRKRNDLSESGGNSENQTPPISSACSPLSRMCWSNWPERTWRGS